MPSKLLSDSVVAFAATDWTLKGFHNHDHLQLRNVAMVTQGKRKRTMQDDDTSDSGDDTPEVITLAQGKADARKQEAEVQIAKAEARQKIKDANRQKDAKLKQRAEATRGSQEGAVGEELSAAERMERAMLEAADEEGGDSDEDEDGSEGSDEEADGSSSSTDERMDEDGDSDETSEFGGFDEEDSELPGSARPQRTSSIGADYLPDEIFESALASLAKKSQTKGEQPSSSKRKTVTSKKVRQKNRHRESAKDIIIGSKIIRMLPSSKSMNTKTVAASRTIPSKNAKHFLQKTLALAKNASARVRRNGWERRPANVGSMQTRSSLPAARFVRT